MFEKSFAENIIANAPLGIVTTDLNGRITFINRLACRMHSRDDPARTVSKHVSELAPPDCCDFTLAFHSVMSREQEKVTVEYAAGEGRESSIRATMTILRDENYTVIGVLVMCEDVSEQRVLSRRLLKEKQFSESIIETANLLIVGVEVNGRIMLFNHAAERLTGYTREEVLGKDWFELFAPESDQEEIVEVFYRTLDGKIPTYHEHPILIRKGATRLIGWHQTCLPEAGGRATGVIAVGEDVTEKRKLEEDLINERERLDTILTSLGAGLLMINRDYEVVYQNPLIETYFGKCVGKKCHVAFKTTLVQSKRGCTCDRCPVRDVLENRSLQSTIEWKGKDKSGNELWVELLATPIRDDGEEVHGALELIVPINERKKLEDQLMQAQKMEAVGMLTGGIAHDFNNILSAIIGYTSLMRGSLRQTDDTFRYVEMIQSAARHATGLTERLLSFSRRAKRRLEEVNINALIKNVLLLVRSSMGRRIIVESDLKKGLPAVIGDRTQFEQMLINILINARDAMPGGGTIHISTSRTTIDEKFCNAHLGTVAGENVVISISDTGTGMNDETRKHIFEPFFSTKKEGQGTGLGLSIVHSVVRGHSGYLDVESMEGKGTKFTIYLPAPHGKAVRRTSNKPKRLRKEQTILLVQNEDKTVSALKESLAGLGFRTLVASDDDEAVRILEESLEEVNLAIVDSFTRAGNSAETFGRLRATKPDLKMIVSCSATPGHTGETLLDGAARLIHKPVRPDELSVAVRQLLGSGGKKGRT